MFKKNQYVLILGLLLCSIAHAKDRQLSHEQGDLLKSLRIVPDEAMPQAVAAITQEERVSALKLAIEIFFKPIKHHNDTDDLAVKNLITALLERSDMQKEASKTICHQMELIDLSSAKHSFPEKTIESLKRLRRLIEEGRAALLGEEYFTEEEILQQIGCQNFSLNLLDFPRSDGIISHTCSKKDRSSHGRVSCPDGWEFVDAQESYGCQYSVEEKLLSEVIPDFERIQGKFLEACSNQGGTQAPGGSLSHYPALACTIAESPDQKSDLPQLCAGTEDFDRKIIYNHDGTVSVLCSPSSKLKNLFNNKLGEMPVLAPRIEQRIQSLIDKAVQGLLEVSKNTRSIADLFTAFPQLLDLSPCSGVSSWGEVLENSNVKFPKSEFVAFYESPMNEWISLNTESNAIYEWSVELRTSASLCTHTPLATQLGETLRWLLLRNHSGVEVAYREQPSLLSEDHCRHALGLFIRPWHKVLYAYSRKLLRWNVSPWLNFQHSSSRKEIPWDVLFKKIHRDETLLLLSHKELALLLEIPNSEWFQHLSNVGEGRLFRSVLNAQNFFKLLLNRRNHFSGWEKDRLQELLVFFLNRSESIFDDIFDQQICQTLSHTKKDILRMQQEKLDKNQFFARVLGEETYRDMHELCPGAAIQNYHSMAYEVTCPGGSAEDIETYRSQCIESGADVVGINSEEDYYQCYFPRTFTQKRFFQQLPGLKKELERFTGTCEKYRGEVMEDVNNLLYSLSCRYDIFANKVNESYVTGIQNLSCGIGTRNNRFSHDTTFNLKGESKRSVLLRCDYKVLNDLPNMSEAFQEFVAEKTEDSSDTQDRFHQNKTDLVDLVNWLKTFPRFPYVTEKCNGKIWQNFLQDLVQDFEIPLYDFQSLPTRFFATYHKGATRIQWLVTLEQQEACLKTTFDEQYLLQGLVQMMRRSIEDDKDSFSRRELSFREPYADTYLCEINFTLSLEKKPSKTKKLPEIDFTPLLFGK